MDKSWVKDGEGEKVWNDYHCSLDSEKQNIVFKIEMEELDR